MASRAKITAKYAPAYRGAAKEDKGRQLGMAAVVIGLVAGKAGARRRFAASCWR